ncbi:retinol dehydrogenase 1 isoform X1 [Anguilla rostrata]|uniref:retinol dehydrogenase 1 isoform X1 n=1 Tax=Anguilla rostrata TaxID=7938 RepID=UPI0030D06781
MVSDMENIPYGVIQIVLSNLFSSFLAAVAVAAAAVWCVRDSLKVSAIAQKWVLVTGCDSGFGHALAQQLDQRGFHVIAACLTEKGSSQLKNVTSSRLKTVLLNVTDSTSIENTVEFVHAEVGEQGLWGLVNNAGRSTPIGPSEWMQLEDFKKVLDVNLIGVIEVTLRLLPLVKKAQGRVVNVASIMGRLALTGGGYCLSKSGVEAFSDSLRRNMKPFGVKVSIIEPGFFKTGVTSLDLIETDLQRLWNQLPAEVRNSYGAAYLEKYLEAQRFSMNILCSADISKVTGCMEHALSARHPRTRYSPGWDAKLIWIPLSYLPSFLSDFAINALLPVPEDNRQSASCT